jgi:hypothetical protein
MIGNLAQRRRYTNGADWASSGLLPHWSCNELYAAKLSTKVACAGDPGARSHLRSDPPRQADRTDFDRNLLAALHCRLGGFLGVDHVVIVLSGLEAPDHSPTRSYCKESVAYR